MSKKTKVSKNQQSRKLRVSRESIAALTPPILQGVVGGNLCIPSGSSCPTD